MSMDPITLKMGCREVTLQRSTSWVGLRPAAAPEGALRRAVEALPGPAARSAELGQRLGGFHLVELASMPPDRLDRQLDLLRSAPEVKTGTHVYHAGDPAETPLVPNGEIYVAFAPDAPVPARQALLDLHALRVVEGRGADAVIARVTAASRNPVTTAAVLQKSAIVVAAEPDLATPPEYRGLALPQDRLLTEQWHLLNTGAHRGAVLGGVAGADARVVAAWKALGSLGAAEVVIAVIDDGFDLDHPDLDGADPAGVSQGSASRIVAPADFTRGHDRPLPGPGDWHGTACAAVALGRAGGGHVIGAAPEARLMPVRWGTELSDREVERWFAHVTEAGAWVVSCSWGAATPHFALSTRKAQAIADCARRGRDGRGCVIVFAAGNDKRDIDDPAGHSHCGFATHPDVIAVAASDSRDEIADYSNFGDAIAICAPSSSSLGWGVLTADVTGHHLVNGALRPSGYDPGDYVWHFGGTSSACPLVAGVAALVLSANPGLTAAEVKALLARTTRRIGPATAYTNGHSRLYGHGCLDAEAAVRAALKTRADS